MAQSTITGDQHDRGPNGKPGGLTGRSGRIDNLVLARRLGDRIWLGHLAEGQPVAALRLCATGEPPTEDVANVIDRAAALRALRSPNLVPVLGAAWLEGAIWVVSEWDAGTSLRRLRQLTWLTPAQAVVVGAEALSGLRDLIFAGYAGNQVYASDIRIDPAGHVRLTGWAAANLLDRPNPQASRECALSAATLLTELATTARRSDPRAAELIAVLDASAKRLAAPGAGLEHIPGVATELAGLVDGVRLLQVRAELAALTQAARARVPAPRPAAPSTRRRPPGVPPLSARVRANVRRSRNVALRWAIALTVLALAAGAEQLFLHGRIVHDVRTLLGSGSTPAATATQHTNRKAPAPVPRVAPARAGVIRSVTLRPARRCTAGDACRVRVGVRLRRHPHRLAVRWKFTVIDRCAGTRRSAPGGTLRAPARIRRMVRLSTVRLPSGGALAVVAVTRHPARAASRPLLVPAGGGRC